MHVAEIVVIVGRFSGNPVNMRVPFSDAVLAKAKYDEVVELVKRKIERKNDLPPMLVIVGSDGEFACPFEVVEGIAFSDYAKANEELHGVADAFPNVFKQ